VKPSTVLASAPSAAPAQKTFRLLVVAMDTFPPARVDVCVLFGQELASRGHHIDWLLQSEERCDKNYERQWGGGTAYVGRTDLGGSLLSRARKHVYSITHDLRLFPLLKSGRYDCIQVKDKFISGIWAVIAAKLFRTRFVYWLSYPFPEDYLHRARESGAKHPLLYRIRGATSKFLLYKLLMPAADHVFVQSEQMKRDVMAEGVPAEKLTPVPMGISVETFKPQAVTGARSVIPPGVPCFLYLGTLAGVRRLDFLIRVLAKVREAEPGAKLYIVGRGDHPSDEQLLHDEARRLQLTAAVVFVGQLPREEALKYVQDADVCVSPFYPTPVLNSTSPTKLVEYMAMGKASVVNDHPEQSLVIQQSGAGYSVPWDETAFANAIVSLLRAPELAKKMGELGRRYAVEHRSYSVIADGVEREMLRVATGDTRA
jgi:glycosyltransferase involved in cell wall biosynthesis